MNKLCRGDIKLPKFEIINRDILIENIHKISDLQKSREIHLEKTMKDFTAIPKKIPSIEEIEEKPFQEFFEEIKKEKIEKTENNNNSIINEEDINNRYNECDEIYNEISKELKQEEKNKKLNEKNMRYLNHIKEFTKYDENFHKKHEKLKISGDQLGWKRYLSNKRSLDMMEFIVQYVNMVKIKQEDRMRFNEK